MSAAILLSQKLASDLAQVNQLITQECTSEVPLVSQVAHHLIAAGGKRIRPLLCLAAAQLLNFQSPKTKYLATAVEFIHSATLLHDDVVDFSMQRRGKPTANAIYGNKMAILVGDFLFSKSFQLMVKSENIACLNMLSGASSKLAQGEVLQLINAHNLNIAWSDYIIILESKTAILFETSMAVMAILANQHHSPASEILACYGKNYGIAFQMADDILDYFGQDTTMGKNIGDDFYEGKISLPLILLYQQADMHEKQQLIAMIQAKSRSKTQFKSVQTLMGKYQIHAKCQEKVNEYIGLALMNWDYFHESPFHDILKKLALEVATRTI